MHTFKLLFFINKKCIMKEYMGTQPLVQDKEEQGIKKKKRKIKNKRNI